MAIFVIISIIHLAKIALIVSRNIFLYAVLRFLGRCVQGQLPYLPLFTPLAVIDLVWNLQLNEAQHCFQ